MERIDAWYRRRLRMVIWKQWKKIKTKWRNLIKLGIEKYKAWEYANTRKSYWRTAKSPIPVSYTHLDVYKRQGLHQLQVLFGSQFKFDWQEKVDEIRDAIDKVKKA